MTLYGMNLLWMAVSFARDERRKPGRVPKPDQAPELPSSPPDVTIQLPLYNEPLVAERLIDACAEIEYPRSKLEIQVLDDSTDNTSDIVSRRLEYWRRRGLDIEHIRRSDRDGFKAGALQNGLTFARGDFIAVFDADFLPPPDFLRRMLPNFSDERVGLVQARWGHLNEYSSVLTRIQAVALDAHFALEQRVRNATGCFISFNGTAGVWRRACIEDAGGWEADTLAEDLDLSYRAQIRGWQFRYVGDIEVPSELPMTTSALRSQQFRWAKGTVEAAGKLLMPLWHTDRPLRVKLQGSVHLTAHVVFPILILVALLHSPILVARSLGRGPGTAYFAMMALGLTGFVGFTLAQLFAQRDLYVDWVRRLLFFPVFMAGTVGLSLSNARAVLEALAGKRTAFVRTPKFNRGSVPLPRSAHPRIPGIAYLELALFLYSCAGLIVIVELGEWAAVPFQSLFTAGFGLISMANFFPGLLTGPGRGLRLIEDGR